MVILGVQMCVQSLESIAQVEAHKDGPGRGATARAGKWTAWAQSINPFTAKYGDLRT